MCRIRDEIDQSDGRDLGVRSGGPSTKWRAATIALAGILVLSAVAGAGWFIAARAAAPSSPAATTELTALDVELTRVRGSITPIAREFTTEPTSGPIDVGAYRAKIGEARRLVDGVNGLEVTDPGALEVRDLILTGGSEVLAGMDSALDALVSDEATATQPALIQVDDGLAKLEDARDLLDRLLRRSSVTRRVGGRLGTDETGT